MSDYKNETLKFVNLGLNVAVPPDLIGQGKYTRLTNVRTLTEGSLTTRFGMDYVVDAGEPVRLISRINSQKLLFVTSSGAVKVYNEGSGLSDVLCYDNFYGVGNPRGSKLREPLVLSSKNFSVVKFTSKISGKDWAYLGAENGMWKIDENGMAWKWGIRPPLKYNPATADLFDASPLVLPADYQQPCPKDTENGTYDCGLDNTPALAQPYAWVYTYYNSKTDSESNPCDEMTQALDGFCSGGVNTSTPRGTETQEPTLQTAVKLTGFLFPVDPQVDRYRIYRKGGFLADYVLEDEIPVIDSAGHAVDHYFSYKYDDAIAGNQLLDENNAVPFTSTENAFGDSDAYGTTSSDPLSDYYKNSISAPKSVYETPLPVVWGPFNGAYIFGSGDYRRPGIVYWTTSGNPETSGFLNEVQVSASAKPVIAGFIYGANSFVFTKDNLYALDWGGPTSQVEFVPREVPIGQGLSAPRGYCVSSVGVFFLYKDGIYVTDGTTGTKSVTKDSLKPIFLGKSTSEFLPINWELADEILLEAVGQEIHFLYYDTAGTRMHLVFDILQDRWQRFKVPLKGLNTDLIAFWPLTSTSELQGLYDLTTANSPVFSPEGVAFNSNWQVAQATGVSGLGTNDGISFSGWLWLNPDRGRGVHPGFFGRDDIGTTTRDFTFGVSYSGPPFYRIAMSLETTAGTVTVNSAEAFPVNSWHHIAVVWTVSTSTLSIYIDGVLSNSTTTAGAIYVPGSSPITIGGKIDYGTYINGKMRQWGIWDRVLAEDEILQVMGLTAPFSELTTSGYTAVQTVYGDENQSQFKMLVGLAAGDVLVLSQATDADATDPVVNKNQIPVNIRTASLDMGQPLTEKEWGTLMVDADTGGERVIITPLFNNETVQGSPMVLQTSSRETKTFSIDDSYHKNMALDFSWEGLVTIYQAVLQHRVDEEMTVHWEHPFDSFGMKGWKHLRDGYFAMKSTSDVTLTVEIDHNQSFTYTIPSTEGILKACYVKFQPTKGKMYRFLLDCTEPFGVYLDDTYVNVKLWQTGNTYQSLHLGGEGVSSLQA